MRQWVTRVAGALVLGVSAVSCGGSEVDWDAGPWAGKYGEAYNPFWGSEWHDGVVTTYAATGEGACSYERVHEGNPLYVAAVSGAIYGNAQHCGACIEITGQAGTVVAQVVDRCPECAEDHLDLSPDAFRGVTGHDTGRFSVSYRFVSCVGGAIRPPDYDFYQYRYKEGSSRWWTAIQLFGHDVPLVKVEYQRGEEWIDMPRSHYNYFVAESGVGLQQKEWLRLRITDIMGRSCEGSADWSDEDGALPTETRPLGHCYFQ